LPTHRICAGCQQTDDAPRHTFGVAGEVDRQQLPLPWHLDCHVLATGCENCIEALRQCGTDASNDGVKNDELRARLIALRNDTQED
jgi:hypothetical protein